MSTRTTAVQFTESEYQALRAVARRRGKSMQSLVKDAVTKAYLRPRAARKRRRADFAALPAFGIWKDVLRTDDVLMNELGSIWNTLLTHEPTNS